MGKGEWRKWREHWGKKGTVREVGKGTRVCEALAGSWHCGGTRYGRYEQQTYDRCGYRTLELGDSAINKSDSMRLDSALSD